MWRLRAKLWHSDCKCELENIPMNIAQEIIKIYSNLKNILGEVVKIMNHSSSTNELYVVLERHEPSISSSDGTRQIRFLDHFHPTPCLEFCDHSLCDCEWTLQEWIQFANALKSVIKKNTEMELYTSV